MSPAHDTYLYLSMCPSYHQLFRQSKLAVETLDGSFCFLSRKGTNVSQKFKCLTSYMYSRRASLALMAAFIIKLLLINNWQSVYKNKKGRITNRVCVL